MWLGRGDFEPSERPDALAQAYEIHNERETEYPIGTPLLADYLKEAPDALGYLPEDYKKTAFRCLGDPAHPVRGRTYPCILIRRMRGWLYSYMWLYSYI